MGYVEISLDEFEETDRAIVRSVMDRGRVEMKEEILAKIERKITEAYAEDNRDLVEFLEDLIRDLELDF